MRRSMAAMAGPRDHEMGLSDPRTYRPVPHVVRHRRPVAVPAGQHGLMPASTCLYGRTIRHQLIVERVKEHSISNRLLWGVLDHINMRFRQRNIPEAEVGGPKEWCSTRLRWWVPPGGTESVDLQR